MTADDRIAIVAASLAVGIVTILAMLAIYGRARGAL